MSNSKLVDYTKISPNKTSPRNHKIDTITIHCVVGQCSVETLGNVFAPTSRRASSNYGIGYDGRIGMYVEEKDRSWCSSSASNDNRAITIEVASDTKHPYKVRDAAYGQAIGAVHGSINGRSERGGSAPLFSFLEVQHEPQGRKAFYMGPTPDTGADAQKGIYQGRHCQRSGQV